MDDVNKQIHDLIFNLLIIGTFYNWFLFSVICVCSHESEKVDTFTEKSPTFAPLGLI